MVPLRDNTKKPLSKYRGVDFHPSTQKWRARITVHYQELYLGLFDTEEAAAKARDSAVIEHCVSHAKLNFPD